MPPTDPSVGTPPAETLPFQAETRQLLDLMIHSLYSNKEIFLRELISNASDALDRLRFEALTRPELVAGDGADLAIRLETDAEARTLTVHDNGIGMSREEVVANVGTIAKSGTRELVERLRDAGPDETLEALTLEKLIGQFGVGFYSSFMVSDRVVLTTRRAGSDESIRWESSGDGVFTVGPAEPRGRGTSVTLHLSAADEDAGVADFTDEWVLARIVKRYSDFVAYPITLGVEREGDPEAADGAKDTVREERRLNSSKPIWTRPEAEVSAAEYAEFYKHVAGDWNDPMETIAVRAEGRFEYQALLFIPAEAPYDLFYSGNEPGLQLYVRRVQIMERSGDLLPRYLRFVRGVVDSPDLPLNVSREMLQHDRQIALIRKNLTKKVLDRMAEIADKEPERYLGLWRQFGRAIKEGAAEDFANRDRLVPLLRYPSSRDPETLTDLAGYVERMHEGQEAIYYLTAESREIAEGSPHLEAFRDRGLEVLFLTDPVDELLVQTLHEVAGKRLQSVVKGEVDLGPADEREEREGARKAKEDELRPMLDALQAVLDERVKQVRLSARLTTSPACLVGAEHDYSPQLERLLQKGKGGGPAQRRILELNSDHPIVAGLERRFEAAGDEQSARRMAIEPFAELLFGYACLAEGSEVPDPVGFNARLAELMATGLGAGRVETEARPEPEPEAQG